MYTKWSREIHSANRNSPIVFTCELWMNAGLQIDVAFLGWAVCMEFRMEMAFLMNLEKNSLLQTFLNGVSIGLLYEWVPEYFFAFHMKLFTMKP